MIQITITADRGEGGTTVCALAIRRALSKLGANVGLVEHSEAASPVFEAAMVRKIKNKEQLLAGRSVGIDTFLPPGVGG